MIAIDNLCAFYGNSQCLKDVDLTVAKNEIVCIVGESGSGKSTLLNIIAGLVPYNCTVKTSRFAIHGIDINPYTPTQIIAQNLNKIGYVSQRVTESFDPLKTIGQHLFLDENPELLPSVTSVLSSLGIISPSDVLKKYPHECSIGMLQRINLCSAIFESPNLLLFDEPTTGIDTINQYQFISLLKQFLAHSPTACIWATHDLHIARLVASRVCVMYGGTFVETGTTDAIFSNPKHEYTKMLVEAYRHLTNGQRQEDTSYLGYKPVSQHTLCPYIFECKAPLAICTTKYPCSNGDSIHSIKCWAHFSPTQEDVLHG